MDESRRASTLRTWQGQEQSGTRAVSAEVGGPKSSSSGPGHVGDAWVHGKSCQLKAGHQAQGQRRVLLFRGGGGRGVNNGSSRQRLLLKEGE